ncbi:hypothetical protein BBJ28_00022502 [Nothophytophthora sp. Chile5]|nr:hypothetical protein BBJ28_00022502 [Nothophytophthora sp. Chile5]
MEANRPFKSSSASFPSLVITADYEIDVEAAKTTNPMKSAKPSVQKRAQDRLDEKVGGIQEAYDFQARLQHQEIVALAREKMEMKQEIASAHLHLFAQRQKREERKDDANLRILLAKDSTAEVDAKVVILKARKDFKITASRRTTLTLRFR